MSGGSGSAAPRPANASTRHQRFCRRGEAASLLFVCRVAVVSKSFEGLTDKTEEWYGTSYKQEAISDATVKVRAFLASSRRGSHLASSGRRRFALHFRNGPARTSTASSNYP